MSAATRLPGSSLRDITMARRRVAAGGGQGQGPELVRSAERMVDEITSLVAEVAALRADNESLLQELHNAVELMDRATAALAGGRGGRPTAGSGRRGGGAKGRATPPEVTPELVRTTLEKLGESTAGEIAAEIGRAGVEVSGRAVRFIAERAGAETYAGADGQRRYRIV